MKRSSGSPLGLYTMGIAALFLAGFLLLVVFGARTYRDAAAVQLENNQTRAMLSYLSTCVKTNDAVGNVYVETGEYGPMLVIGDGSGYALHIYQEDRRLLEEYSGLDAQLNPNTATVLGATDVFTVETPSEYTLKITTDVGSILLHLRSGVAG